MEKTKEKSEQQAAVIQMIAVPILMLDEEYCRELVKDMFDQAHRQESLAVLNPSYPQVKNEIIITQALALKALCDYVHLLKEVDELKKKLTKAEEHQTNISKFFL